jgi:thiamine-phosphate diphosphorylase
MPKPDGLGGASPLLCMVTPGDGETGSSLIAAIVAAANAGVDLVQIRERHLDDRQLLLLTRAAVAALSATATRVLVNDRLDVALAAGAAGVHLRSDSFSAEAARRIAPPGFLIGRSVHSEQEALDTEAVGGCDYLVFGTVFPSTSKPAGHPTAGLDALRRVCERVRLPVLAIGGIAPHMAGSLRRAGASGLAAIGLFRSATDMPATVRDVRSAFDSWDGGV